MSEIIPFFSSALFAPRVLRSLVCKVSSFSFAIFFLVNQIINCIWNHPDVPVVYLACDMLGQEDILLEVFRKFGSKIYVDKAANLECFRSLMVIVPEIVSDDPSSRFHIAQWYVCDDEDYSESVSQIQKQIKLRFSEAVKDEFGIWHVCYSMHSSREELESAMQLLSPKWVVSTVPSCRAMELDYVKRNCFISRFSSDDLFWKLLDIDMEVSSVASTVTRTVTLSCCLMSEGLGLDSANPNMEPVIESSRIKKQLLSLSPEKNLPTTLFGRARLISQVSDQLHERRAIHSQCIYTKTSPELEKLNLEEVVDKMIPNKKQWRRYLVKAFLLLRRLAKVLVRI